MEAFIKVTIKLGIDVGLWAWSTWLLATAFGWPFGRMCLVTAGLVALQVSYKPWPTEK